MNKAEEILLKLKDLRDKKAEQDAYYDERIDKLKLQLEACMNMLGISNASAPGIKAYWRTSKSVGVKDWDKVMQYVEQNKAYDILQRRISAGALEKRFMVGDNIPGVSITVTNTFIVGNDKDEE